MPTPGVARSNSSTPTNAIPIPNTAPAIDRTTASEKNGSITWKRLAPSAERTAASLVRNAARASSRLATLAHAISSTKIVAICIAAKIGNASSPMACWMNESNRTPTPSFDSGYSVASRCAIIDSSR